MSTSAGPGRGGSASGAAGRGGSSGPSRGGGGANKGGVKRGANEKSHILEPPKTVKRQAVPTPSTAASTMSSGATQQGAEGKTKPLPTSLATSGQPPSYHMSGKSANSSVGITSPSQDDDMNGLIEEMDMDEQSKSTLPQASFNYINSIIGSGVIGMPYAIHLSGVGLGVALMALTALITDYSLVIMIRSGKLGGTYSYQGIMEASFGVCGFYILSLLQFIYPLIAMISYNIIVGDTLTKILIYFTSVRAEEMELQRELVVFLATVFVTLPLSLYRDVARMAKISFISLVSIGFIMLTILIRLDDFPIAPTKDAWQFSNTGFIQSIGIFAFAFMCHHNSFLIFTSMKNRCEEKWAKVTHISIGASLAISLMFALGGYATFTGNVQGDLLENYCWDDNLINISRVLFCLTILLTFPLECFVARDVIENLFFSGKSSTTRHFSITLIIVVSAFLISMSTDCLGIVLELNGVLAALPLAYILPALCYIRLEPSSFFSREKLPAILTAAFGITISLSGLIILITNGSSSSSCSHGKSLSYCVNQPGTVLPNGSIIFQAITAPPPLALSNITTKASSRSFYPQYNPFP